MNEYSPEDMKQVLLSLFRNKLLIVFITGAGLFAGLLYTARTPAVAEYRATVAISVAYGHDQGQIPGNTIISHYSEIITSDRVCRSAASLIEAENLTANQIRRMTEITEGDSSYVLWISARSDSPRLAILAANAVAESFVTQVSVMTGNRTVRVMDAARSADIVGTGGSMSLRLLAPAAAFIVACVAVILIEFYTRTLRSVRQCIVDEGELLAVIPALSKAPGRYIEVKPQKWIV